MAASFDGTASYLSSTTAPIINAPLSVGAWVLFTSTGASSCFFALTLAASAESFSFRKDATNHMVIRSNSAGAATDTTAVTADAVNTWVYVVGRCITSTNRRLSVLHPDGAIEHVQGTASKTPTGMDAVNIGGIVANGSAQLFWPGLVAELWYTNTDIQPDAGQLDDNMVRQLAYHGPYSVPNIPSDLIEYHGMRSSLPTYRRPEESGLGKFGHKIWTNNSGVGLGHHPPLPYEYDRPLTGVQKVMV